VVAGLFGGGGGGGAGVDVAVPRWAGRGGAGGGSTGTAVVGTIVTDLGPATAPAGVSITFNMPGSPLSVTAGGRLPNGQAGRPYHARLTASGGTLPYVWRRVTGSLPHGLSLSPGGMIGGTRPGPGRSGSPSR